ncbi:MAG: phosphopantetheine-binding protein [Verrucomicrobia bacterium]|nr:phosphopantetheine-binding protein [Verrucomicrobiota bacterium]
MPTSPASPESIIALLHEHDILGTEDPINADSDLFSLGLDSLALMQLLLHLEAHFEVTIPTANLIGSHFSTPRRLAEWISSLQLGTDD